MDSVSGKTSSIVKLIWFLLYFSGYNCFLNRLNKHILDVFILDYEPRKRIPKFLETVQSFKNKAVIFMSDGEMGSSFKPCTAKTSGKLL